MPPKKTMAARDLLHVDLYELTNQRNATDAQASIKSIKVGEGKVMSYADIEAAKSKREVEDEARSARKGRKRKESALESRREAELDEAKRGINALGFGQYCSVFLILT